MTDEVEDKLAEWPSVDEALPVEEGGPVARKGFNYQDEVAVSLLLDMLESSAIEKIHCETHDDILVVHADQDSATRVAEFVQVKAGEPDQLWSVASLCQRKKGKSGTSIFEVSLARDKHKEEARFRVVTLRDVNSDLKLLTYEPNAPARQPDHDDCKALLAAIEKKCPGSTSDKGNCTDYWIANCRWEVRHSEAAIKKDNLLRIIRLSQLDGHTLLFEHAELLLGELRYRAKTAGDARGKSEWSKKIITRTMLTEWWKARTAELIDGASAPSGGKLRGKMEEATLPEDVVDLAVDMRRRYAKTSRTPKYMEAELGESLQDQVKAEVLSMRSKLVAGELDLDGRSFHALCIARLDEINAAREADTDDHSAFLKGCMYDIADRCLMRFVRPE